MSERVIVATRKGLFDIKRKGGWEVAGVSFLGSPVSMAMRDPRDGALYAALDLGHFGCKLHRSDDDGASWTEIAAPSYEGVGGDPAPSLKLIWALEPGGPDEPGALWAGTIPGGLFRSEDRGASWTLNRALWDDPSRALWTGGGFDEPGLHSICIDPRDSKRVTIGVSTAGVWKSDDRGKSWRTAGEGLRAEYVPPELTHNHVAQDAHCVVQCAASPEAFWLQHHNGIFRSTDDCATWRELQGAPSSFGFPVAAHPNDPNTAWFAPAVKDEFRYPVEAKVVVSRTRDGGQTFEILREGLPQTHAYDLIYRHGLVVDETGERLAMGSTTGHLWISENGGDTWASAAAHLPPIYALRFA
ncbi:MAG: WD40/YVTN/BNR-like repeat-containing protein [Hyphomonadaceae bacterium]